MPSSLPADPAFRRDLVAAAERAVRLAERDVPVLFLWRFDRLLRGVTTDSVQAIRDAQYAAGRQRPAAVFAWHLGREPLSVEDLAAVALWFLAESATRTVDLGARVALGGALRVLGEWEARAVHAPACATLEP